MLQSANYKVTTRQTLKVAYKLMADIVHAVDNGCNLLCPLRLTQTTARCFLQVSIVGVTGHDNGPSDNPVDCWKFVHSAWVYQVGAGALYRCHVRRPARVGSRSDPAPLTSSGCVEMCGCDHHQWGRPRTTINGADLVPPVPSVRNLRIYTLILICRSRRTSLRLCPTASRFFDKSVASISRSADGHTVTRRVVHGAVTAATRLCYITV